MLTMEDCIAMSDLTEDEIDAIAEHEHLPEMAALEMGWYLVQTPEGERRIKRMIVEDIDHAHRRGDSAHAAKLKLVLRQYIEQHPRAVEDEAAE